MAGRLAAGEKKDWAKARAAAHWPLLGLAFVFAWNTVSSMLFGGFGRASEFSLLVARSVALLAIGLGYRRMRGAVSALWANRAAAALGAAAAFSVPLAMASGSLGAMPVAGACVGCAQGFLMLAWLAVYSRLDFMTLGTFFIASNAVSTFIPAALQALGGWQPLAVSLFVLPVAAFWLSSVCARKGLGWRVDDALAAGRPAEAGRAGEPCDRSADGSAPRGPAPSSAWTFPLRPTVLIAFFAFAAAYARCFASFGAIRVDLLSGTSAALLSLLVFVMVGERFEIKLFHLVGMPLLAAGLLCTASPCGAAVRLGCCCSTIGFMLFQFFLSVSLSMASYRYEIDPLWLFGPVQSMRVFGTLAGTAVGTAVQATGAAAWPVLDPGAVVLLAAMAAYSLFLGGDSAERAWGVHPVGPHEDGGEKGQGQDAPSPLELQLRACALVARRYGLTRREEDVLVLLAQGKTVSAIQEELYVSNPTVKSHVRHIYMKMGIHSREELASAVAAVGAGLR